MKGPAPYRRLRWAGRVEGVTLILLLGVAVPLKRVWGYPDFASLMGPVHGLAFIAYALALAETVSSGGWRPGEIIRTALVAIIPFGPFLNDRFIGRKAAEIEVVRP